jgi:hypothetical protein
MPVIFLEGVAEPDGTLRQPRAIKIGAGLSATMVPDGSLVGPGGAVTGYLLIALDPEQGIAFDPDTGILTLGGDSTIRINVEASGTFVVNVDGHDRIKVNSTTTTLYSPNDAAKIVLDDTGIGENGSSPVARPTYTLTFAGSLSRTLNAYTTDPETSAYTGATDGEAKLSDLNDLRVAYETLRASHDNLIAVVKGLISDFKLRGTFA